MEQFGNMIQPYLTTEVASVLAAIAVAWVGWKAACKGTQLAGNFASKTSFAGLTAAVMLFAGLGGLGAGIGELRSRTPADQAPQGEETQLTNSELVSLAKDQNVDDDNLTEILKYASNRDKAARERSRQRVDADGNIWVLALDAKQVQTNNIAVSYDSQSQDSDLPFEVNEVTDQAAIKNDESIMSTPMAWTTIGLGFASIIGSLGVFFTRPEPRHIV